MSWSVCLIIPQGVADRLLAAVGTYALAAAVFLLCVTIKYNNYEIENQKSVQNIG